jgi:hypothetical protein
MQQPARLPAGRYRTNPTDGSLVGSCLISRSQLEIPTSHEHAATIHAFAIRSHRLFSIGSGVRNCPGRDLLVSDFSRMLESLRNLTDQVAPSPVTDWAWLRCRGSLLRVEPSGSRLQVSESSPRRLCRAGLAKATCYLLLLISTSGTWNNILIEIMAKALTVSPRRLLPFAAGLHLDEQTRGQSQTAAYRTFHEQAHPTTNIRSLTFQSTAS